MKFPLVAIGDVSVGGVEYRQGDVFDAGSARNMRYLIDVNAAKPVEHAAETPAVADGPAVAQASAGDDPEKTGTHDDQIDPDPKAQPYNGGRKRR